MATLCDFSMLVSSVKGFLRSHSKRQIWKVLFVRIEQFHSFTLLIAKGAKKGQ